MAGPSAEISTKKDQSTERRRASSKQELWRHRSSHHTMKDPFEIYHLTYTTHICTLQGQQSGLFGNVKLSPCATDFRSSFSRKYLDTTRQLFSALAVAVAASKSRWWISKKSRITERQFFEAKKKWRRTWWRGRLLLSAVVWYGNGWTWDRCD